MQKWTRKSGRLARKIPLLTLASVGLPVLGVATLPVTIPLGIYGAWSLNRVCAMLQDEEAADDAGRGLIAIFGLPIPLLLTALPFLCFAAPISWWKEAFAALRH